MVLKHCHKCLTDLLHLECAITVGLYLSLRFDVPGSQMVILLPCFSLLENDNLMVLKSLKMIKMIYRLTFYAVMVFAIAVFTINIWVAHKTKKFIFDDVSELRVNKVGLLLGTAPLMKGGKPNPFFENRIAAAVDLYSKGKILNIIVSGDNRSPYYNEPEEMRRQLVRRGIPNERIYPDYAGLRTLDSVIRCGKIFGQAEFTVISQRFHNQRAVFLARAKGFDVIGFNAKDVDYTEGFKTRFREYFARVAAVTDLITYKEPRFLGDKIEIF